MSNTKNKRYKNIDRQMLHDDMIAAAESKGVKVTVYARMCGLSSNFRKGLLDGSRYPTEYLMRQTAKALQNTGVKRHWQDYLLPDPEPVKESTAEPEQMVLDLSTIDDWHRVPADPTAGLSDKIDALTDAVLQLTKISRVEHEQVDIQNMGRVTPHGSTPADHINLKMGVELMQYVDEEAHRLRLPRTEFINRVLIKYAKEHPHEGGIY